MIFYLKHKYFIFFMLKHNKKNTFKEVSLKGFCNYKNEICV
jgi:hypothetical protein